MIIKQSPDHLVFEILANFFFCFEAKNFILKTFEKILKLFMDEDEPSGTNDVSYSK